MQNNKNSRPILIIPSETQVRELDAKLLLACTAAERGFSSIVGSRYDIHLRIASLPRGIYVGKDVRQSSLKMFRILADLGYRIVAWDEEALLPFPADRYYQTRVSAEALKHVSASFAWGAENAELFREYPNWGDVPIHVTGNPRFDLLRPELRNFFAKERDRLRSRYGDFILVNTNFGMLNHYVPNLTSLSPIEEETVRKVDEFTMGLSAHRYKVFAHFKQMIPVISERFPDFNVVIRPHPSENHRVWQEIARKHDNVQVVFEGSVLPWLLACQALIHNGCTTAIEAYAMDQPAVAYRPVTSERFEKELPNGLSLEAFDIDELIVNLARAIERKGPIKSPDQESLVRRHLTGIDGDLACERILDVLETLEHVPGGHRPGIIRYARGLCRTGLRAYQKQRNAGIHGHKNSAEYQQHRFPGIQLTELQERVILFGELLGRFRSVQTRQISENIFQVYAD